MSQRHRKTEPGREAVGHRLRCPGEREQSAGDRLGDPVPQHHLGEPPGTTANRFWVTGLEPISQGWDLPFSSRSTLLHLKLQCQIEPQPGLTAAAPLSDPRWLGWERAHSHWVFSILQLKTFYAQPVSVLQDWIDSPLRSPDIQPSSA